MAGKVRTEVEEPLYPSVYRCDLLPARMNPGKAKAVLRMLNDWRSAAGAHGAVQWRLFQRTGRFDPRHDAWMDHGRMSAKARRGIVGCIGARYGLADNLAGSGTRRVIAAKAPGFIDPLADLKRRIGAAQNQMVRVRVVGVLDSFIANRMNDYVAAVHRSSITNEETRHMLFAVNRARAWFDLERPVVVERDGAKLTVPESLRRLARKIMHSQLQRHRKPRMDRIGIVVDQRIASLAEGRRASTFPLWLKLNVFGHGAIAIPLTTYERFDQRQGERRKSFQLNHDRRTGAITVGVITDVGEAFAGSRKAYAPRLETLALDFGTTNLFATQFGDILGRGFQNRLMRLDHTIQTLARRLNRLGVRPRSSARFYRFVGRVRGLVTTEVNRVLNRLVQVHRPGALCLEKLDFRMPGLSARMNRILQNCGRSTLRAKLAALEEELGIVSTETGSAYTSQTCSCCGYVDKRNRTTRDRFSCLWCGKSLQADVNAARNIGGGRSAPIGSATAADRRRTLATLVTRHRERWSMERRKSLHGLTRRPGAPPDPRLDNPYFREKHGRGEVKPGDTIRVNEAAGGQTTSRYE